MTKVHLQPTKPRAAKSKAPTLGDVRRLAAQLSIGPVVVDRVGYGGSIFRVSTPPYHPEHVRVDHPSRAVALRMLWAALKAMEGGK